MTVREVFICLPQLSWGPRGLDRHLVSAASAEVEPGDKHLIGICMGEESCDTTTFPHVPAVRWGSTIELCGGRVGRITAELQTGRGGANDDVTADRPSLIITELRLKDHTQEKKKKRLEVSNASATTD